MSPEAIRELIEAMKPHYMGATKAEKSLMVKQLVELTGYHPKSISRLFRRSGEPHKKRPGRPKVYHDGAFVTCLLQLWKASGYTCAKYLKAVIPELMPKLERWQGTLYDDKLRRLLTTVSASTIDRVLRPHREARAIKRTIRQRQASTLRNKIAVHTFRELRKLPVGYAEIDLVMHSGKTLKGFHLTTLVAVEITSSWTECYPVWGKNKGRVQGAIARLLREAPYTLKGICTDNGSEFINEFLYQFTQRMNLDWSHSRPYEKNDQPRVEQRNGSIVRTLAGYGRYDTQAAMRQLEEVYRLACQQANFIKPVSKLISSERHGAKVSKHYDKPKTPYQRLLESDDLTDAQKAELRTTYDTLDPLQIQLDLEEALDALRHVEGLDPASEKARLLQEQIKAERAKNAQKAG